MAEIIIAEITAHNGTSPQTLRFATQGYTTGAAESLGPELVSNGDFAAGVAGWTGDAATTISAVSGRLRATLTSSASPRAMQQLNGLTVGRLYRVQMNVYRGTITAGNALIARVSPTAALSGGGPFDQSVTTGDLTIDGTFVATASTLYVGAAGFEPTLGRYLEIDNVSVKEVVFPANTYYDGRIEQPGNVQRAIFNSRSTFGRSQMGYGEIVLVNSDGALDQYLTNGFAGFPVTIKRGTIKPNQAAPDWTTILAGVMDSADFTWNEVSIKVRDRQQELDKPLQATLYAGNNALPAGLEGVAGDLQGKPKPILYGKAFNFAPPCVNTSRLIYQVSDGLIQSVDAVFDRGTALSAGAAYSSQADMETNAPSAGQYRAWINAAGSYIRLGSAPAGTVTVDATQGAAAANRTAAQLMALVLGKAGIPAGDISAADVAALDTANAAVCGYWVGHDRQQTGGEVLDALSNSVGAWWGVDRFGKFRMSRVVDPAGGVSVGTLTEVDILRINRMRSTDPGAGIPAWQARLNHSRYFTTQNDLGASVAASVKSERSQQWRSVSASDATVKTKWPKAVELTFDTYLTDATAAATEATRRLDLYKVQRDMLQIRARLDDALAAVVDLGAVVLVQVPRFAYTSGKKMLVVGIRTDLRDNIFELTLWG